MASDKDIPVINGNGVEIGHCRILCESNGEPHAVLVTDQPNNVPSTDRMVLTAHEPIKAFADRIREPKEWVHTRKDDGMKREEARVDAPVHSNVFETKTEIDGQSITTEDGESFG